MCDLRQSQTGRKAGSAPKQTGHTCEHMTIPHGVLQELRQDVIQRQWDEREASSNVTVDPHPGGVSILVFTQTPGEGRGERPGAPTAFAHSHGEQDTPTWRSPPTSR